VSEREIAAEIVRAWRQGHVGSYVWQDTLDELERFIAAALAAAHAATERGPLVSCPWCGVRFADDCPASQQIRHLIECGDWLRAQVATLTAERDDYSRTAIDALAEVAALRAALEEVMVHARHTTSCSEQAVASLLSQAQPQCVCGRDAAHDAARAALQPGDGGKTSSEPGA
jgi:sarcosine oxidase delta subunit